LPDTSLAGLPNRANVGIDTQWTLPAMWTSASRPVDPLRPGAFGFNTETGSLEFFTGSGWVSIGANLPPPLGISDGSNPPPGAIGELLSSAVTTAVAIATGIAQDLTSIALTAGDWDVVGTGYFQASSSAGTDDLRVWVNTASATQPTGDQGGLAIESTSSGGQINNLVCAPLRVNVAVTTQVFLSVNATFGTGTMLAKGLIRARRMR
jgi:hypothetical protein